MKIGIDFDNTIACYEGLFHQLAVEKGFIPNNVSTHKDAVRNYLRSINREDLWTEMQGFVYGPGIVHAKAFPGFISFVLNCREKSIDLVIVSHKTRNPFKGPTYDLHASAKGWLGQNNFFRPVSDGGLGFKEEKVFFELTKEEKCQRIANEKCDFFIDDLPELLTDSCFPKEVKKILLSPNTDETFLLPDGIDKSFASWGLIQKWLLA